MPFELFFFRLFRMRVYERHAKNANKKIIEVFLLCRSDWFGKLLGKPHYLCHSSEEWRGKERKQFNSCV